jgi:hypothetical protein
MLALNNLIKTYASENKQTSLKINLFEPPLIESNFINITSPGEDKKNLVELSKVVTRIISCLEDNTIETGEIFNFS